MRCAIAVLVPFLAAALAAGCQSKPADPVAITAPPPPPPPPPGVPRVEFDSTTAVAVRRSEERITFFVTNVGTGTAYHVRAYWRLVGGVAPFTGNATPSSLAAGQSGIVPFLLTDQPKSAWPAAPDSLRWSATP